MAWPKQQLKISCKLAVNLEKSAWHLTIIIITIIYFAQANNLTVKIKLHDCLSMSVHEHEHVMLVIVLLCLSRLITCDEQ